MSKLGRVQQILELIFRKSRLKTVSGYPIRAFHENWLTIYLEIEAKT